MPVSVNNSEIIFAALKSAGITLLSALPETWLIHVMQMAEDDPDMTLIRLNKEDCLLYTSPSPRDRTRSRMPSSA